MKTSPFLTEITDLPPFSLLKVSGHLDAHTAPDLEEGLRRLLEKGQNQIVVDFEDLDYISSAGLGVFMGIIEEVRSGGGDIKLASMSDQIYSIFELLGFPLFYDIAEDVKGAIDKFKTQGESKKVSVERENDQL